MALSAHALTTVATVKDELGISVSTFDSYIERKINVWSDAIEKYCNRHFEKATALAEAKIGEQGFLLALDRTPIISITSITYNGQTLDSTNYEIFDPNAGLVHMIGGQFFSGQTTPDISQEPFVGSERKLYTVTYVCGYVLPWDAGTRTLPYDLEDACISCVVSDYRRRGQDPGIKRESLMSASVEYQDLTEQESPFPAEALLIIDKYRRVVVP